jgi:ketosteroid isomerase-like protein
MSESKDSKRSPASYQSDDDIVALNQSLLNSIVQGDFNTYTLLCADDMTCFEPEANDCLVKGKAFHKFYFDLPHSREWHKPHVDTNVTMCDVHVRRIGKDVAIVSYVRLNQIYAEGKATTTKTCETRVWEQINHEWRNVHLHRS